MSTLLENLPDINFAEKDTAIIVAEIKSRFEEKLGRRIHEGDPWHQTLLTFAYWQSMLRSNIDFAGKQNLLKYSQKDYLKHIGALLGVEILAADHASTMLEFTLSTVLPSNVTIRAGTRVTPGGNIVFATDRAVDIPAGELSTTVSARCEQPGEVGNGFLPGTVNRLMDPFPFSYEVQNTTLTQGGSNEEDIESFRERIRIAPERFSTAGPYGAYIYWAKTASPLLIDVSVRSPSPGVVDIVPLLQGGEVPTQSMLDDIYNICNDEKRRPLTDKVVVRAPEVVHYDIKCRYFIARSNASIGITIQKRFGEAVEEFILWQKSALGRAINVSKFIKTVMKSGIKRVEVESPIHTPLAHYELGVCENVEVIYGGIEDD